MCNPCLKQRGVLDFVGRTELSDTAMRLALEKVLTGVTKCMMVAPALAATTSADDV